MVESTKTLEQEVDKDILSSIRDGGIGITIIEKAYKIYPREDFINAFIVGLISKSLEHNGKNIELSKWYFGLARDLSQGKEIDYFGVKI